MEVFRIKQGDRLPVLQTTLYDSAGAIDLTNVTTVTLLLKKRPSGTVLTYTGQKVQSGSTNKGVVKYVWAAGNTDTIGFYDCEWELTFSGGEKMTVPNKSYDIVEISPDLN